MWVEALMVIGTVAAPPQTRDQAVELGEFSARVTKALNIYAEAAEPGRPKMGESEQLATALLFASGIGVQDNSLSLSGVCQLLRVVSSPAIARERVVAPLIEEYRTSGAQHAANLAIAMGSLPPNMAKHAQLVLSAVTMTTAAMDRGCGP